MPLVLIIDPNNQTRNLCRAMLEPHYAVEDTSSKEDGEYLLMEGMFDLIIVDEAAARWQGKELIRKIRSGAPNAAIVFLTEERCDISEFMEEGATMVLRKPFGLHELAIAVHASLEEAGDRGTAALALSA
jgi:two-component system response regulator CiaR